MGEAICTLKAGQNHQLITEIREVGSDQKHCRALPEKGEKILNVIQDAHLGVVCFAVKTH